MRLAGLLLLLVAGCAPQRHPPRPTYEPLTGLRDILVPANAWLYARPSETAPRFRIAATDDDDAAGAALHFVVVDDRGTWLEVIGGPGGPQSTGPLHDWGIRLYIHRDDQQRVLDPTRRRIGGGSRLVYWPDGSLAGRASGAVLTGWGAPQDRGILRCGQVLLGGVEGVGPPAERTITLCLEDLGG